MTVPQLYVRPEYRQFGPQREAALIAALDDLDAVTVVQEVDQASDLTMFHSGTLSNGYRYTSLGLKQVCALACPGLYQTITDLAGCGRGSEGDRADYSFADAVRIYNRVVSVRFEGRFAAKIRLLVNNREKLVEGVLGPRYTLVSNAEIRERARDAACEGVRPMAFHEATLVGRRLQLRFIEAEPLFTLAGAHPEVFRAGMHFANSEVGGESTVRAAILLVRDFDGGAAMGPYLGGRRVHTGRDFARKLGTLFAAVAAAEFDAERLEQKMQELRSRPLFLDADADVRHRQLRLLTAMLHEHHVGRIIAHRALMQCVHAGASGEVPTYPSGSRLVLSRTAFDLYCALAGLGKVLYATAQEAVEQVAYGILTGRVHVPPLVG